MVGELAQGFRELIVLAEDLNSVPSIHIYRFTTACYTNSRGSDAHLPLGLLECI